MTTPWLHIVGIGEDGLDGLVPATRAIVEAAEVILGGDRHHDLAGNPGAERIAWPSPFDAMIDTIKGLKGRRAVVLVTGDPLWFSVGARIGRAIPVAEIVYHPQLSAFQLAAARMGWSLADVETLTVHGRPVEQMIAFIQPDARLLILTTGAETPARIARFLTERGYGAIPDDGAGRDGRQGRGPLRRAGRRRGTMWCRSSTLWPWSASRRRTPP
jgi:precorrin-6B C5,15-methyltransferase / cobalt-precorrin-6B C5,C15-methyltransferase